MNGKLTENQIHDLRLAITHADGKFFTLGYTERSISKLLNQGLIVQGLWHTDDECRELAARRDLYIKEATAHLKAQDWRKALIALKNADEMDRGRDRTCYRITEQGIDFVNNKDDE